jgi:hypothetical protein
MSDKQTPGEKLCEKLLNLEPNGNFLPASVACDFAGKRRFIDWLDEQIAEKFCFCEIGAGGEPCRDRAHCDKFNDRVQ